MGNPQPSVPVSQGHIPVAIPVPVTVGVGLGGYGYGLLLDYPWVTQAIP